MSRKACSLTFRFWLIEDTALSAERSNAHQYFVVRDVEACSLYPYRVDGSLAEGVIREMGPGAVLSDPFLCVDGFSTWITDHCKHRLLEGV